MTENIIINILTLLAGGSLGWLINWRANKRKANGEAIQTEADAMKSAQDFYQQTIKDQQEYITKVTVDRDEMREEREEIRKENVELRNRLNKMDEKMRQLANEVQRNRQIGNAMRVWLCGRVGCTKRIQADFGSSDSSD